MIWFLLVIPATILFLSGYSSWIDEKRRASFGGPGSTVRHDGHVVELPNKASIEMWKGMSDKGKSALVKIALGYCDDDAVVVAHDKVRVASDITSDEFMRESEQEVNDILAGRA
jgi:hypothetical protein